MDRTRNHTSLRVLRLLAALALLASGLLANAGRAAASPVYDVHATWADAQLAPGRTGVFTVQVRNLGDAVGSEPLHIVDQLPSGVTATSMIFGHATQLFPSEMCEGDGTETVSCTIPASVLHEVYFRELVGSPPGPFRATLGFEPTGYVATMLIQVAVDPGATGTATNVATVSGGSGPQPSTETAQVSFSGEPPRFGVLPGSFKADAFDRAYPFGSPSRQAGGRPFEQRVDFDLSQKRAGQSSDSVHLLRSVEVTLPRGEIGNPEATPKCDPLRFAEEGSSLSSTGCASDTQVGYINVPNNSFIGQLTRVPIYNLIPPRGTPVDFGFKVAGFVEAHLYAQLDPAQGYAIKTVSPDISNIAHVLGSEVTIWGVPGDPSHDKFRAYSEMVPSGEPDGYGEQYLSLGAPWGSAPIRPLLTNPTDCGFDNGGARIRVESYTEPGFTPAQEYGNPDNVSGCEDPRIRFEPQVEMQPTDEHADAPTGLDVHLKVPQRADEVEDAEELYAENGAVRAIATPPLKKAVVTFPEGMTLSPSAAQGLGSCSAAQIGLGTNQPVTCPDGSQYGTLTIHTPILPVDNQPEGFIYIAKQNDNPFHNFLSIYLVIEEPERGILVKIPGRIDLDPRTGQITTTFDELPQFPVSDMQLTFKGGVRAGLVEPSTCGQKTIRAEFFSWADPTTPHVVDSSYEITEKPDGSPCVNGLGERPFRPQMSAGTVNNAAGTYSPFVFRLTRTDDDQEFSQIKATLPEGLAAKFAGVAVCSDAGVAQALSRETVAGDGALELADPSCPASSQIGTTEVGAGVGVPLSWVPGKVYLAGPYEGAPISMVVISPAVIGPYDLGVITVRTAIEVDPETARATAISDPFPQVFQGIPVRIRDIRLKLDREGFTLNPTSCAEKQTAAHVTGVGGDLESTADDAGADLTQRFQAAECGSLAFHPRLAFRLFGGTRRGAYPKFQAILRAGEGQANIARASVALPSSEFLGQEHIGTVCTRVQFTARECPGASVYGFATAKTPLFDQPLSGPVYLRSSSHRLPDLVAALRGPDAQPVEVDLDGRIDSVNGGIRNTFEVVPDAPVSEFKLTMQGGRKGLLRNSENLCLGVHRVTAKFQAQNGKALTLRPALRSACAKHARTRRH